MAETKTGAAGVPFMLHVLNLSCAINERVAAVRQAHNMRPNEFAVFLAIARADLLGSDEIRVQTGLPPEEIREIVRCLQWKQLVKYGRRANTIAYDVWLTDMGCTIAGEVCRSAAALDAIVAEAVGKENVGAFYRRLADIAGYLSLDSDDLDVPNNAA